MTVGKSRHPVWETRRPARWLPTLVTGALALLLGALTGCQESPESLLARRWRESDWKYEKLDIVSNAFDVRELTRQHDRRIVRHESESWQFLPDGTLIILKRDGQKLTRRWHLKGRGHVLTLHAADQGELEVYDIKELTARKLVLHYDIGLEVRGIAQLSFASTESERVARRTPAVRAD